MSPVHKIPAYPKQLTLLDGAAVTTRPMTKGDEKRLLAFFLRLPEEDRFFLKDDVSSPKVIGEWAARLDYDRALPLLALVGDRVVADAVLIRSRMGSRQHVGEIRVMVDTEFRQRGLGTALIRELCDIANDAGLEFIAVEVVQDVETQMIEVAERLGFLRVATLARHIKDRQGNPHDLTVMVLPLAKWHGWWRP